MCARLMGSMSTDVGRQCCTWSQAVRRVWGYASPGHDAQPSRVQPVLVVDHMGYLLGECVRLGE